MKKEERGSGGGEEANKWDIAAIQAQTMEAGGGRDIGQFLRECFPAAPWVVGKIRTSDHPQLLHLPGAVGLLLGCLVGHHEEESPDLPQKNLCPLGPQSPTF